jgi:hypothetical protein
MNQPITLLHAGARSLLCLYQRKFHGIPSTLLSGLVIFTLFLSFFPGYAQKRIGLHVTQEELDIWRSRARTVAYMEKTGPYQQPNDVSPNSPGDWKRILKNANDFVANPSADRWSAYTGGGCVPRWSAEPGTRGERLRDAGFAYLITTDKRYSDAVRKELLAHANNSLLDFSRKNRWCEGVLDDINPGFFIAEWMSRLLVGYDYIRTTVSQDERNKLDKWFANAAFYFQREVDRHINNFFVDRNSENYTLTLYGNNSGAKRYSGISHYGGRQISNLAKVYNNRRGSMVRFFALVGIQQNIGTLKQSAKLYVKEWLRFSTFPDGIISEFYRWTSSKPDLGWAYASFCVAQALDVADHFARAGDMELYRYSTSAGMVGTEGGNKNIHLTIKNMLQYLDGSVRRYATNSAAEVGKQHKLIDGIMPGWEVVSDIWFAQGNVYYKDNYIKNAYLRKGSGTRPYPYQQASAGPTIAWSGAGGIYPGKLLMFGQMEGKVWPYYTGSGTPPTHAPTPASAPTSNEGNNTTITVNAWSTPAGGVYAHFNVLVNGIKIGDAFADSRNEKPFRFNTNLKPGEINSVIVHFDNNGVHGREDRDLYVRSIVVGNTSYPSTGSNVTYDKGALDGKDVIKGSVIMPWNGGLVFKLSGRTPDTPPVASTPPNGSSKITVNAYGSKAVGVYAHFNLLVNGAKIGEATTTGSLKAYTFTANIAPGSIRNVTVYFDNDFNNGKEDRNLIVKSLVVNDITYLPTGSNVFVDKGELDGKDIRSGREIIPWDAGLVFNINGANARGDFSEEDAGEMDEIIAGVTLSPNPNNGMFSLKLSKNLSVEDYVYIAVFDVIGKQYYEEYLTVAEGKLLKNINLSHIPEGMYLLKVRTGTMEEVKKFVKQ